MSLLNLDAKYQLFFAKAASPKSCDGSRVAIYRFEKFCRHCGAGLSKPAIHDPRIERKLYKFSYCSEECKEIGPHSRGLFVRSVKTHISGKPSTTAIDDMVDISKAIDAIEKKMPPFVKLLREANSRFNILSEKLSYLEMMTKEKWGHSRFYYWMERIGA